MMCPIRYATSVFRSTRKFGRKCHVIGIVKFERNLSNKFSPVALPPGRNNSPFKYVYNKIDELVKWYEEFTGLKDVRTSQQEVVHEREKLSVMQEERRKAFTTLLELQSKLKDIYAQLENTKRGDERYVNLIREEHALLKQEEAQKVKFRDAERSERDQFNIFSNTVRDSHAKERTQSEKTKYWSIIGSITGAIIGIIGTSINNHFRMSELRNLISDAMDVHLQKELQLNAGNNENLSNVAFEMKNNSNMDNNLHRFLDDYINKTNKLLINLDQSIKKVENISNSDILKLQSNHTECESELLLTHLNSLTESIRRENDRFKMYIIAAVLGYMLFIPFIIKGF